MSRQLQKLGLKRSLFAVFGTALLIVAAVLGLTLETVLHQALERQVAQLERDDARAAAAHASAFLGAEGTPEGARALAELQRHVEQVLHADAAFMVVLRADQRTLARAVKPAWEARLDELLAARADWPPATFFERGDLYVSTQQVQVGAAPAALVVVGRPAGQLADEVARVRTILLAVLLVGFAALLGILGLLIQRLVVVPLGEMSELAVRVSESDLTGRATRHSDDELGLLAGSLNRIVDNLGSTLQRIRGVSEALAQVIEQVSRTGSSVAQGAGTVTTRVGETSAAMSQMLQSLRGIAGNVEVLAQAAEESSASIQRMASSNEDVTSHIGELARSVAETTTAIEHMTASIKEVASNVEDLSATAEETARSMTQMDVSISQVESNANETAKLSEQATRDAELGAEAISRTLTGIDKIKASSKEAAAVIEQLGQKIGTIGNILNVIDDVAEQTNLLALNAAILAAQSGEHGKGFAVVADEIKDLAERTGASTKEISGVIRAVQQESRNAIQAMERGVKSVEEGVRLGQEAETALKKIQSSSQLSTQMVRTIAGATVEQARGSKAVTQAISRIAEAVQQIARSTGEQARGSEQIMKSAGRMQAITGLVERSSQEQAAGSRKITRSIESVGEMVQRLNRAQKEQTHGSEGVLAAVKHIREVAEAQAASVNQLGAAIAELMLQAEVLRAEVKRFHV
ncbi:MAG: methyl-accepting chemotaxis protein [Deltaproteobacteria bacterium]|nr:methyl-accepting chemotaxis protein [Deltaproteobacteria bacterium]